MKGYLFGDFEVELDPRTAEIGGSWQGKWRKGQPVAYDWKLVKFFYQRMLEYDAPAILDIGASTGSFCLLTAFHPGATALAFEPNPAAFDILKANVALNGLKDQVQLWDCALSDVNGKATLKLSANAQQAGHVTLGKPRTYRSEGSVEVRTRRLDDLEIEHIDLVKLDVEGMELAVMRGGERLIGAHRPGIVFEFNQQAASQTGHKASDPIELLWSLGYRNFQSVGNEDIWATA